ncbi:phosphatidylglycerophosphate phosphatase PTPMT1 [Cornus florida]|uniref:phosphatidylglycerophosphate phosphatase PTPMT1 n=1 Tax=Cornus florida TaxID=4283 RepID=UPI00289BE6F0|nr:phosphatidylglycerophosphate phosphatase PTPMT1 [Cornus florida]XP_059657612.1 phosphatidylglycerophosphate phosphatase PTPMT1 [Cornus florida]
MYIEDLDEGEELGSGEEKELCAAEVVGGGIVVSDAKRVLIGAGARALFYPTLLYNVVRNKIQAEFRWWDRVDEFVLLGAVPFPTDVKRLKELGVCGVITLNEPYETLVPTSLYQVHGIDHLVLPTRDYLYAPSLSNICEAVDFIHRNASRGRTTYVHCKAGRGRSTTIVICYLVQYKQMMPDAAYEYVKSIRPRVLLASSQWQAVLDYYYIKVKGTCRLSHMTCLSLKTPKILTARNLVAFDDSSLVVITKEDLDGYDASYESVPARSEILADLSLVYRVRVAGQTAFARLSCLWFRCHSIQKISSENLHEEGSCSISADQLGGISVNIHVY